MRVESLSSGTDTNRAIENFYFSILYPIFSIRKVSTVSVPSGDFLFSNTVIKKNHTEMYCIPSPPETSYFLMIKFICVQSKTRRVSVPSGDFLFSNKAYEIAKETGDLFPSPPGTPYFLIILRQQLT